MHIEAVRVHIENTTCTRQMLWESGSKRIWVHEVHIGDPLSLLFLLLEVTKEREQEKKIER